MRTVPINVYIKDELISKGSNWELGLWTLHERQVWGLVYEGRRTHMCYRWPQDDAKEIILRNQENFKNDPDYDWKRWFFDVGRRLYVTDEDLEEACKKLEIWDKNEPGKSEE